MLHSPIHINFSLPYPSYRFHQHTDLLYLTGCQEPDVVLLLESTHGQPLPAHKSILYVRPQDPFRLTCC